MTFRRVRTVGRVRRSRREDAAAGLVMGAVIGVVMVVRTAAGGRPAR
ncbi:MAG: hypothetical protein WBV74_20040 [Pseudonocardiaceae bacterium]